MNEPKPPRPLSLIAFRRPVEPLPPSLLHKLEDAATDAELYAIAKARAKRARKAAAKLAR
jgi:hypothetical protein